PRAALSSPRAAPAAHSPPQQPASRPCSPRAAFSSPRAASTARSPPLQPANHPCSPLPAPAACLPPVCGPFAAPAARSPPIAARASPSGSPLAAPCSPRAALWQPTRRPLQPARRPLAARSPPLAPMPHPAALLAPPCLCRPARAALLLPALLCAALLATVAFDTLLDDLQLYLLSDSRDSVSLFDHTFGASLAPPATADSATRSQWLTRDAAARLAARNEMPIAERAHFGQHKTAQALYDAVVARYSSPATASLGRLLQPYLFPKLCAFATVEDLVTHLRTSDARYRAALPAEFLDRNPPLIGKHRSSKGKDGKGGGGGSGGGGGGGSGGGVGGGGGGSGGSGGGSGGFGGGGGGNSGGGGNGGSGSGGSRGGAFQRGGFGGGRPPPPSGSCSLRGGAARGAASGGAEPTGAEPGAESEGAESEGVEPRGTASAGGPAGTQAGGAGVTAGVGGTGGAGAAGPGGARTRDPGAGGAGAGGTSAGGAGAGGAGAVDPGAGDPGAGGAGTRGAASGSTGAGGTVQRRPFFVPPPPSSLPPPDSGQVLSLPSSIGLPPCLQSPPPCQSQPLLQPNSPLPAPSPYAEQTDSFTERCEPESRPALPVRAVRTGRRVPRPHPPPVPGTHIMALRSSSVPLRVPLQPPQEPSLPAVPDPESDLARAASPTVPRLLATVVIDPSFESTTASALVAELVDIAAACHLDCATSIVARSESDCPSSVGAECALSTDILQDRQEDFECLAAAEPHLVAMLLAPEGDPDAPDILTQRSYAEAITGPYSSQWQTAMDAEMASWKSSGTYVDAVPPSGANIVDGMWIFRVKRSPDYLPDFKARYVARGFSQRQGVDFFHNFSPTPKMTTLWVLLHVAAQRDYELHSLDFSTTFLQGSLHEENWLHRPPGFTRSFPAGTQWSLQRLVYGLRQVPRAWHDTSRMTLAALGFAPSTVDPSLFLRTDTSLPPLYILVYVDDLVFATANTEALGPSPPSDESVEPSGPYPELLGCLMYLMTCTRPNLAYPLSIVARYVAPGRHRPEHWEAAKRVLRYLCSTSGMWLVLGGRSPVVLTGHADASWCDSKDGLSLFDLTSGASTAPTADADSIVRSQWLTRDVAARLAVRNHLPSTERAHFSQYKSARALYDAVVARYSSPTTAALSRLMLPYLFPDLAAFATIADLVAHLRTSDARYRAALPTEFLPTNSPPMYITLYYLVTCLPDSLSSVRDHYLSLCPTELTVDLLEERLAEAEKSILAVGASRGDRRTPFFEGCYPVPLLPSVASAAAVDLVGTEEVNTASAPSGRRRTGKGKGSKGGGGGGGGSGGGGGGGGGGGPGGGGVNGGSGGRGGGGGGGGGGGSGGGGSGGGGAGRGAATQRGGLRGGQRQQQLRTRETPSVQQLREWYAGCGRSGGAGPCTYVLRTGTRSGEFPDAVEHPRWHDLLLQNVPIFDLDFDAILAAMYALADITERDCYLRVPPDPGTVAAALGASASAALGAGTSLLLGTAPTESFHTFTLDSGASCSFFRDSTTLTLLSRPVAVSNADPSGGPVLAHSSTVLPCPAASSGLLSGLHLPSFSTNLVSGADLQDTWVDQFTPGGQRVTHCTCSWTGRHLATFTRRPGSSLYTLTTAPPPVSASGQVAASSQVFAAASRSSPASASCSYRPLAHETLLWHHRLGHPSLPRLRDMASRALVSGLPKSLPPLPPGPAPTCVPCVKGRQHAAPHSSSFPPTEAPLQTLHMHVWGPARVCGQGHERYFLLVVDDYSRYTTVFPLRSKGEVIEGIRQTFTLPASPQQNRIAEGRIGMVMDVARTSMIHAATPHFLWPFAVQYAAHQINLQPRVSLPETTPTLRWTGKVGDASAFRVWGSRAFVRDSITDKLSSRAVPCVFLGFPPDAPGWQFYHPTSRRVLSSQDVTFDESGPAPSGVSKVDPAEPVEVAVDSGAAGGAETGGAESGGAETGGAETGGAETGGAETGGAESGGPLGDAGAGAAGGAGGATGATGGAGAAGGGAGAGAAGGTAGAGAAGGAAGAVGVGGAPRATRGAGAAGGGAGAGAPGGATGATGGAGAAGSGAGARAAGGAFGTGDPGAEGTGSVSAVSRGAARPRPYYVPLLPQPAPPLPGPSPYSSPTRGLTERREPESRPVSPASRAASPIRPVHAGRVSRPHLPPVPGTHSMTLRPSTAPQRVPLPSPPTSSLPDSPDPESDSLRAGSPNVTRFLATAVTDPLFVSSAASALVAELVDFAAACRLDYATSLVAASASVCPPSIGGECDLGTDVLENRQEDLECFAAASPHLVSMLLAPEGDPDALDIPTLRSYAGAIEGPYSSQWQAAMDAEMASWKSTGTYVDEVPPPGANIISGMWIFRVKRPPGSPRVFKACYVARGFSQRHGVDFFQTFSPTPKMTTLQVLLHVAAHRDYELHSLDFSTAFLQGSLHEEIRLRRPSGFTGSFPSGTQWSLRRLVYGLRQAPREWHDTLRTTLAALGFAPSSADPSLFLRTYATLPPFYVLVYVDDLVFATADTEALAHVKSELQKRHTCTDLGELTSYLGLRITRDRAQHTITLTQSHMVHHVLQRFGFTYSSPQSTPLPTTHSLSAPPLDESVEPSGPYPELVGCLMYLMTCTRPDLAYPLSLLARYVAPGRHRKLHWDAAKRVLRYLCSTSGAMAAQELRWLTYLLTDLGEAPRSPPVLYIHNKAMLALCQEHRLEHRTKHIALRYFLARELQQRGQLRLAYVASQANTADVFTKALQPCDHQRFCTVLGLVPTVPHLLSS
ncbi:unnamed protein product, partial [Closterium sp. NIES-54]